MREENSVKRVPPRKEFLTEQARKVREPRATVPDGEAVRDLSAVLHKSSGEERASLCAREESK